MLFRGRQRKQSTGIAHHHIAPFLVQTFRQCLHAQQRVHGLAKGLARHPLVRTATESHGEAQSISHTRRRRLGLSSQSDLVFRLALARPSTFVFGVVHRDDQPRLHQLAQCVTREGQNFGTANHSNRRGCTFAQRFTRIFKIVVVH